MARNNLKVVCISASNTSGKGDNSASTKVCRIIEKIAAQREEPLEVEIIPLMEKKINFCMLCGDCFEEGACPYDKDFNEIYAKLKEADISFFVVPHYTPVPSKLLAIFEKVNEILYANLLNIPQFVSPFINKSAAIIGHGGMAENSDILRYYHDVLISPIANTLRSFGYTVIGWNDEYQYGIPFGLKDDTCMLLKENEVFPEVVRHWDNIENRIKPFVKKVLDA